MRYSAFWGTLKLFKNFEFFRFFVSESACPAHPSLYFATSPSSKNYQKTIKNCSKHLKITFFDGFDAF